MGRPGQRALATALEPEQVLLALPPARVPTKLPAAPYHTVARHDDRDPVRAERVAGRATAAGRPGLGGDLCVREHLSERDPCGGLQHAPAEAVVQPPVDGDVEAGALALEVLVELPADRVERGRCLDDAR